MIFHCLDFKYLPLDRQLEASSHSHHFLLARLHEEVWLWQTLVDRLQHLGEWGVEVLDDLRKEWTLRSSWYFQLHIFQDLDMLAETVRVSPLEQNVKQLVVDALVLKVLYQCILIHYMKQFVEDVPVQEWRPLASRWVDANNLKMMEDAHAWDSRLFFKPELEESP